jgi:hypothetical protein
MEVLMKIIRLRFNGTCPLLMHSERGANPLDKSVQAHKKLTSKRAKTDEDQLAIAWSEYQLAIYFDEKEGPFIPAQNIDRAIVEGARKNKLGKKFESSARCVKDRIPLIHKGPNDVLGLYESGFVDIRSVGVSQSRVMRVRPMFREWSVEFDFAYDETEIEAESVLLAAETAGRLVGICDYRPRFGRFDVEVSK